MLEVLSGCVVLLCIVRWEILRQGKKKEVRGVGVALNGKETEFDEEKVQ